jgi:hypothetical protein
VNIALVVSREGMPLGYQLFAGNRNDVTTLEEIVERIERLYGKANRIWVLDRGIGEGSEAALDRRDSERHAETTGTGVRKQGLETSEGRPGGALVSRSWWRGNISSLPECAEERERAGHA